MSEAGESAWDPRLTPVLRSFPLVLTITKASQALLAGNCIIVKTHPTAPCTVLKFVELAQSVFPPGVLQVLCGGNDL